MKYPKIVTFASGLTLAIWAVVYLITSSVNTHNVVGVPSPNRPAPVDLKATASYQGLPVAEVKAYTTPNAWGQVLFIPQYHKNPGSDASDPKNDSAQKTQQQIYQILSFLISKAHVNLVTVEGEVTGEVPAEKVAKLAQKLELRNQCLALLDSLKSKLGSQSLDPETEQSLYKKLADQLASADREIILEGAPIKLKAEGKNFNLVGSENKQTQEESKVIVRNYIYLEDRLNQLENPIQKQELAFRPLGQSYDALLQLLLYTNEGSSTNDEFSNLESKANLAGKKDLAALIQQTETAFSKLQQDTSISQSSQLLANSGLLHQSSGEQAPSREDNPYQTISSQDQLKKMVGEAEKQIDDVIVKKRNLETAQNFAQALKNNNLSSGVLQFGAGHEEGLINELQKQGLNVIVIKPQEVANRKLST